MNKITIGIVDDQKPAMEGLVSVLGLFDEFEIIFKLFDGKELVQWFKLNREIPDVIILDIEMQEMSGIEALKEIRKLNREPRVLMLTVAQKESLLKDAISAGASGYLLKGERPVKLRQAILDAMEDRISISPEMNNSLLSLLSGGDQKKTEDFNLTKRELDVLENMVGGKNYQEIAGVLFISPLTVRSHMENIYRKLEVNNKVDAVKLAIQNGWF
ncbi:MAG: response regulator transcription factor [Flavobacteriales bacterium]